MISSKRLWVVIVIFLCGMTALLLRLGYLQLILHDELTEKADSQQIKTMSLNQNSRGKIFDRNGETITNHEETPSLMIFPSLVKDAQKVANQLEQVLFLDGDSLSKKIEGRGDDGTSIRYLPFVAKSNLTLEEVEKIRSLEEPGIFIVGQIGRYRSDLPAIHLLGELGTATEEDILSEKFSSQVKEGDLVGLSGLERIYDSILQGQGGETIGVLVDDKNRPIYEDEYYVIHQEAASSGSVKMTLDLEIQQAVESALSEVEGAAVILDAQNGDVLAMASSPKYDPNHVTPLASDDAYMNKALNAFPPASLFKIFLAAVALEDGVMQKESLCYCDGIYHLENGKEVHCWKEEGHGLMLFEDALSLSCNPVFITVGKKIGVKSIRESFGEWGLDKDSLIGYPLEHRSEIETQGQTEGDIANLSLGESGILMTPLNLAKMINVIASGGFLMEPRLIMETDSGKNEPPKTYPCSYPVRVIKASTASAVKDMMKKTFQSGTGKSLNLQNLNMAGKTGTSETGNVWIGGFFPAENPRYTIVILVENGSSGVGDGGPILKKICAYLNGRIVENKDSL
ncbi:MAG: penicillin-binding transpeptidase domain-containing protein [Bacillota bacterium]|nr:penicillin-binding transpeptidase domain-containing protein [Bacillota bacterium]